jgi:hypothetical protein
VTDPALLAVGAAAFTALGAFGNVFWRERSRARSSICPPWYGPLDAEGLSEAWSARVEPVEGRVLVHPDDESRGFVLLDDGRVGEVDVVPSEAMLIGEDAPRFAPSTPSDETDGETA